MSALVYVAGPYTAPDPCINTHTAIEVGTHIYTTTGGRWVPFIPHLSHFWHTVTPMPYKNWLHIDNVTLVRCDAVIRLPGASSGADAEVNLAIEHRLPVWAASERHPGESAGSWLMSSIDWLEHLDNPFAVDRGVYA